MSVTIAMRCDNPQPPPAGPDPDVRTMRPQEAGRAGSTSDQATICEVSPRETVTWTMPRATYALVARTLETWPVIWGRRPKANVVRALDPLEQSGCPEIRKDVTRVVKPTPEPEIRGYKADVFINDPFTAEQIAALNPGKVTKP